MEKIDLNNILIEKYFDMTMKVDKDLSPSELMKERANELIFVERKNFKKENEEDLRTAYINGVLDMYNEFRKMEENKNVV